MTVGELVSTVGVMLAVLTGAALWYEGGGDRAGAASAGVVMEALYEGAEQFVREHGAALEDCLDNAADPATGNGPFMGIPLYSVVDPGGTRAYPAAGAYTGGFYAASAGCYGPDPLWGIPSIEEAGLLPAELAGRGYPRDATGTLTGAVDDSYRYGRLLLEFRVLVRRLATPEALQLVVVGWSSDLTAELAQGMVAAAGRGGVLRARDIGVVPGHRTVLGSGGGWRMHLCAALTFAADVGGASVCPAPPAVAPSMVLDLDVDATLAGTGPGTSDARNAFGGEPLVGGGPEGGRVVMTGLVALGEVARNGLWLHRTRDPARPEHNRMEVNIDAGGWGFANVGYLAGVLDATGTSVARGVHVVGPAPGSDPAVSRPVTFIGDLVVTGSVRVGSSDFAAGVPVEAGAGRVVGPGGADVALWADAALMRDAGRLAMAGTGGTAAGPAAVLAGSVRTAVETAGGTVRVTGGEVQVGYDGTSFQSAVPAPAAALAAMTGGADTVRVAGVQSVTAVPGALAGAVRLQAPVEVSVQAGAEAAVDVRAASPWVEFRGRAHGLALRTDGTTLQVAAGERVRPGVRVGDGGDRRDIAFDPGRWTTLDASATVLRRSGSAYGVAGDGDVLDSRLLSSAFGRYTFGGFAETLSCGGAGADERVAVPFGWRTTGRGFPAVDRYQALSSVRQVSMNLGSPNPVDDPADVAAHVPAGRVLHRTGTVLVPRPAVGWAADPRSGDPVFGTGTVPAGFGLHTLSQQMLVCDWQ